MDDYAGDRVETTPLLERSLSAAKHGILSSLLPCCAPGFCYPQEKYRSQRNRTIALVLFLLCQLFSWTSGIAITFWFPRIADTR